MADADKDKVWTVTLPLANGTYEYKYTTNGWDGQVEDVPHACDVTGGMFHNRGLVVAGQDPTPPRHAQGRVEGREKSTGQPISPCSAAATPALP